MWRSPRVLRRSRLILLMLLSASMLWPATTVKSSATSYVEHAPSVEVEIVAPVLSQSDAIDLYILDVAAKYDVDPNLIKSVVWHESRYNPNAIGDHGRSVGLMQVGKKWHYARMERLGVSDLTDPYGNILVGTDYLAELIRNQKSVELALMVYNMGPRKASELYLKGKTSEYAKSVIRRASLLKNGGL